MSLCGASSASTNLANQQSSFFGDAMKQAGTIFGNSSAVFGDLMSSFAPIVAAGVNQTGFSPAELAARNSSVISNTGQAYKNASQAVREQTAAQGGGNMALPSGAAIGADMGIAEKGAEATAEGLNKVTEENYATGRQNYFEAAKGLAEAPGVFGTANQAVGEATNSGEAASKAQNNIDTQNSAWLGAVGGILGSGVSALSGGLAKRIGGGGGTTP